MSLLPYFDHPLRVMEQEFFGPGLHSFCLNNLPGRLCSKPCEKLRPSKCRPEVINGVQGAINKYTSDHDDNFTVNVDVHHFTRKEIKVKVIDGQIVVEGKHEEKPDQHGYISRQFVRKYDLPERCLPGIVFCKLSSDGVLTVIAPKVLPMPSTGEKIIPIKRTGPIRKELRTAD